MAGMAQALQVVRVNKHIPSTSVSNNMINICCANALTTASTFATEWLAQELIRTKFFSEYIEAVPVAPYWSMPIAVGFSCQYAAADMCAWFQGL